MIKNAREYQITRAQAARFERALAQERNVGELAAMVGLERDALRSQLADLNAELDEYDALESGRLKILEVNELADLPQALIRARIAGHLSQKDLAERLNLKEQQIQRYEATDYASASLTRLVEVVRALGVKMRQDVVLSSLDVSLEAVVDRLRKLGFDRKFIESRFVLDDETGVGWRSANAAARVLGLRPSRFFSEAPELGSAFAQGAYKMPVNASEPKAIAYAAYARYLAEKTLAATPAVSSATLPDQPREFYDVLNSRYGGVSFASALRYVWDLGIPVLPLREVGGFHGAFWKIGGRSIIVIKQNVASDARWLIDLLHEYFHAVRAQSISDTEVIEQSESPFERRESEEEMTATAWANAAALGERETELAQACADAANGQVPRMKAAVQKVAKREGVPVGVLANYVAFKLAGDEQADWWGTATNLQPTGAEPWRDARDLFLERVELHRFDRLDRELFMRALSEEEN